MDAYRAAADVPQDDAAQTSDDFADAMAAAEARRVAREQRMRELDEARERRRAEEQEQAAEEHLAYREQEEQDEAVRRELERKHGYQRVLSVPFPKAWVPNVGAATRIICLIPDARSRKLKVMQKTLARLKDDDEEKIEEVERLARTCIVYPHPDRDRAMYEATMNLVPLILGNLAKQMIERVAGRETEARKK